MIAAWLPLVLLAVAQSATAQTYPVKPVRIVTTAPGSANDFVARVIVQKVSLALGQPVIIDNRGFIAAEIVARSAHDGYTLISYGSPLWLAPFLRDVSYHPMADFTPVVLTLLQLWTRSRRQLAAGAGCDDEKRNGQMGQTDQAAGHTRMSCGPGS